MTASKRACIVCCFDTYSSRVDLLDSCLSNMGFSVDRLSSDYRHIDKEYRDTPLANETLIHVPSYKRNISPKRVYSHRCFAKQTASFLKTQNYDLCWVLLPPNQLAAAISRLKSNWHNTKLVFDVIDMWPETMPYDQIKALGNLFGWGKMRNSSLSSADLVVTECNLFANILRDQGFDKRTRTLLFSRHSRRSGFAQELPCDSVSLCYLGSVNHLVDIDAIAEIIKCISVIKPVKLHVIGAGEKYSELIEKASAAGAETISHGAVHEWSYKQAVFDVCHYGLNVMKSSVCVGLTMKSIDYLDAGLPLINTIKGDTWDLVESEGAGFNYPEALPTLSDITRNNEMRAKARNVFDTYLSDKVFESNVVMCLQDIGLICDEYE